MLWTDLDPSGGGLVEYTTIGTAPYRTFIVQYWGVKFRSNSANVYMQLKLYETTNIIELCYGSHYLTNTMDNCAAGIIDQNGGSGHFMSITSGTSCSSTSVSTTVCNNANHWDPNFVDGTVYRFDPAVQPPAAPTLISPSNGATSVALTPNLDWSDVSGATSYSVQVSTNSGSSYNVVNQTGLTSSNYSISSGVLSNSTIYYWRVSASNSGGSSSWSSVFSFTTLAAPPTPPPAPMLLSPSNGATGASLTPNLDWGDATGAASYTVQVSTNSGFSSTVVNQSGLTSSGYTVPNGVLNNGTMYYWRANATNNIGTSSWSSVFNFTTVTLTAVRYNRVEFY